MLWKDLTLLKVYLRYPGKTRKLNFYKLILANQLNKDLIQTLQAEEDRFNFQPGRLNYAEQPALPKMPEGKKNPSQPKKTDKTNDSQM